MTLEKKNSFVENFRSEFLKLINASRFTTFTAPDRGLSIGPSNVQKSAVKVKSDVASLHDLPMRSVKLEIQIVRKLGARRLLGFFLFHMKDDECLIQRSSSCMERDALPADTQTDRVRYKITNGQRYPFHRLTKAERNVIAQLCSESHQMRVFLQKDVRNIGVFILQLFGSFHRRWTSLIHH